MANEFVARNGIIALNNSTITGSLTVTGGVSGSFSGSGANLYGIPASSITGLSTIQIATGSVTASVNVTGNIFQLTSGSSTLLTVNNNGKTTFTGSVTATSALAQGVIVNTTLSASANSDVLVAMDINPTFVNTGSFTSVANVGLRVNNSYFVVAGDYFPSGNALPTKGLIIEASGGAARISSRYASAGATLLIASSALTLGSATTVSGNLTVSGANSSFFQFVTNNVNGITTGGTFASYGRNLSAANDMVFYATSGRSLFISGDTIRFASTNETTEWGRFFNTGNLLLQTTGSGLITDSGYKLSIYSSGSASGSLYSNGFVVHDGLISGSQPANNPSASLILISGSITPTGSLSGSSAILMNTVMSASANNQTLNGLDINPTFNTGAYTGITNNAIRVQNGAINLTNNAGGFYNYNTADQVTNYQRGRIYWGSTANDSYLYSIVADWGGSASNTATGLYSGLLGRGITVRRDGGSTGHIQFNVANNSSAGSVAYNFSGFAVSSTGQQYGIYFAPNVTQTGAGSYTMFYISAYEQTTGSGAKNLIDVGTNSATQGTGTHTSKFSVQSTGQTTIGAGTPSGSAMLQVISTTQGFLPPKMTQTQRDAISSPATGLMIFNTDSGFTETYNGTAWTNPISAPGVTMVNYYNFI
jgi:hypothetical protein